MLGRRRRWWANIKSASVYRVVFAGWPHPCQQTRRIISKLVQCGANVEDVGPTLNQCWNSSLQPGRTSDHATLTSRAKTTHRCSFVRFPLIYWLMRDLCGREVTYSTDLRPPGFKSRHRLFRDRSGHYIIFNWSKIFEEACTTGIKLKE